MIQSAYDYSEMLSAPRNQFPQDASIQRILENRKQKETFEFDLMELAERLSRPGTPETELFYQVSYEGIYRQMYGDRAGQAWLSYDDFTARLGDNGTKEAYKSALEQALQAFKRQAEFLEAREALYRLAMFWYLREN
ncbi:hypothetical protein BU23DRAFT_217962 [Bimuria novae-zelandiae CBS 107.79]|uniref:Uncharacterized protein n=1 Tax=Bimuria novae-zelandiae CBS 107.79 TaxID=1447943 RepID=A0A6A5V0N0_9PLEO|nr:hypothetical protein BU23DRAFT_217962 [Bimuria novae-zelandiae CBS 107.79]